MKPFVSFFVILLIFQSLFFGSLVKLEFPDEHSDKWDVTLFQKQVVLDPFLMPGKDEYDQNIQYKNEWVSFHFNKSIILRNNTNLPIASVFLFKNEFTHNLNSIPVFIMNGILRI
jgi:hypothetical protein